MTSSDGTEDTVAPHDLRRFFEQDLVQMQSEYERIFARSTEDPGTAGDEGEANWATFLESWLPQGYRVVTKGRLIGTNGTASPQVDVVVLRPGYPQRLVEKKLYLVDGVAAVFECKNTLKASHISAAAQTAAAIRRLSMSRSGNPYREIVTAPIFGILAHSHSWKGADSTPLDNIAGALETAHSSAEHPALLIDVLCVADLALWDLHKTTYLGPPMTPETFMTSMGWPTGGATLTAYVRLDDEPKPVSLAGLATTLLHRLGVEDSSARPLADYFRLAGMITGGGANARAWSSEDLYSERTLAGLRNGESTLDEWGEWALRVPLYRFTEE